MGTHSKKGEVSKKGDDGKKDKLKSKNNAKDINRSKSKKKGKDTETKRKSSYDKKNVKPRSRSLEKERSRKASLSNEDSKKKNAKVQKKKKNQKETEPKNKKNNGGGSCFLCCCCAGNENEELNEMLFQQEQRADDAKKRREEEAKKRQEEARMKRDAEEERMKREAEEERIRRQEEEERIRKHEEEEEERIRKQQKVEEVKEEALLQKKTVLKKVEPKPRPPIKKAQLVFTGYAAAPPPPPASECAGSLPKVRATSISLSQGAYLVYKDENGGQLEIKYSKTAISEKGVLAYIATENIPSFYFNKNDGTDVLLKDVKRLLMSEYVNDRILYYEKWNEFIKLKKNLDGTLYLLPAFEASPPARIDIIFLSSQQKKIQHAPVEKPVEMVGDYMIIIQRGLDIFKKEINVDSIVSYVNSFGVLTYI